MQPTFLSGLNDFSLGAEAHGRGISAFARYMPLDVVQPLISRPASSRVPDAKLQEITVMFADLPGFTWLTGASRARRPAAI